MIIYFIGYYKTKIHNGVSSYQELISNFFMPNQVNYIWFGSNVSLSVTEEIDEKGRKHLFFPNDVSNTYLVDVSNQKIVSEIKKQIKNSENILFHFNSLNPFMYSTFIKTTVEVLYIVDTPLC